MELSGTSLRDVFDMCDVDKRGLISVDHLIDLARQHFSDADRQTSEGVGAVVVFEYIAMRTDENRKKRTGYYS